MSPLGESTSHLFSSSTLILLNGRRITASAYADPNQGKSAVYDLNAIPISAIERVEIFKDGASAVYGSDAIAGVINFITKTDYQGGEVSASISANDDREFGRKNASAIIGFGDLATDRFNAFVAIDVAKRNSTLIKNENDIEAAQYADINGRLNAYSSSLSDQPFFYRERTPGAKNFANSYALRADVINRTNCPASQQITGSRTANNLSATDTLVDRTFCNYNIDDFSEVQSAGKDANLLSCVTFQLTPDLTSFTELGFLVDYNRIRKEDETALLSAQFVIDHPSQYPGRVIRDNNPALLLVGANGQPIADSGPISQVNRAYVNQGSTETSGIDFEVAYRKSLGEMGKLTTKLNYSYALTFRRAERPGETEANVVGTAGGISDWATSVGDIPRHKANLSANWTRGVHSLTGSVDFVSAISLLRRSEDKDVYPVPYRHYGAGQSATAYQLGGLPKFSNYNNACEVKSWTTVGVAYSYTGIKDLTLSFNIKNLFDIAAPYDPRYPLEGFNPQLHNGQGRYFKLSANYKFK
jgi:outer membrane receptor protein involved in Fe transport